MGCPVCVKQQCFDARVKYRGSRQGGCSKREAQQGQHQRDFFKKTLKKTLPMKLSAACSDVFLTELARNAPSVHCVANPATAHSFRTTGRAFCCSRAIGIRFESTGTLLALPSGRQCCTAARCRLPPAPRPLPPSSLQAASLPVLSSTAGVSDCQLEHLTLANRGCCHGGQVAAQGAALRHLPRGPACSGWRRDRRARVPA